MNTARFLYCGAELDGSTVLNSYHDPTWWIVAENCVVDATSHSGLIIFWLDYNNAFPYTEQSIPCSTDSTDIQTIEDSREPIYGNAITVNIVSSSCDDITPTYTCPTKWLDTNGHF